MSLAIVIPSKTLSNLEPCVIAIMRHEATKTGTEWGAMEGTFLPRPDLRVIVVDDGLEKRPIVPKHHFSLTYLNGRKPFVYAVNCNMGIREAMSDPDCEGVVLLNDDALLESPNGFSIMAQAAKDNPEYGIIGAVTDLTGQPLQRRSNIGLRQVPHIAFVCCYIPRTTFDRVGLLDENYNRDYGVEDRDMCEAVNRAGMAVGVHDNCFVNHSSLVSSFRGDPKAPKSFQQNYAYFKQKWGII
jgi:GT2 family glycosyltransferase